MGTRASFFVANFGATWVTETSKVPTSHFAKYLALTAYCELSDIITIKALRRKPLYAGCAANEEGTVVLHPMSLI